MHNIFLKLLLQFLSEEFLAYFQSWRDSVAAREGFTNAEKNKMFLTQQSYEGLQTTGRLNE